MTKVTESNVKKVLCKLSSNRSGEQNFYIFILSSRDLTLPQYRSHLASH